VGELSGAHTAVSEAFRSDWGRVVEYLIRVTGNWDLAEECAQDAFEPSLERWPRDGIPPSPAAWLKTTARNRALDRLRRSTVGEAKLKELGVDALRWASGVAIATPESDAPSVAGVSSVEGADRMNSISSGGLRPYADR
jgi:predicted RNA polymerase sigma factor